LPNISFYKPAFISVGLTLLAALATFALFRMGLPDWLQYAFVAALLSAMAVQTHRLWINNLKLTEKLIASSIKLSSFSGEGARSRLESGLKLLDTVLSLKEAVLFQRECNGDLGSVARLRASSSLVETGRNSIWREGIDLCERAIKASEIIITKELEASGSSTIIALPLHHENRAVGALLIRLNNEFDDDDRALLTAVGAQLARSLQREEACGSAARHSRISFLSTRAGDRRLELLDVLNGLLSEQRFGLSALSEISEGMAIAYLDGTIPYINSALLRFAHLSEEQGRDLNLFDLLDALRTSVFHEPAIAVRRVLQTGEAYERELQFPEGNGTFGLRISLVFDHGDQESHQPLCLAVNVRDITRLKEHEQLKSDMISLMSHELRTPITSINGFSELLIADDQLPEQAKEFVTIIANESQRLSRMINSFLAVTQLERKDKQEVLKIPLRLDQIVRETVVNLQSIAKKKRIRLVEQPNQRIPPVAADKSLISQAVTNLVSNAIKYSPERTTVTVSTALEAEAVRVSVEDRGFGIPPEAVDRVWEKFYRVVREGQEKDEESTGLGLSFVREVIEQHGGAVDLESEVGRGSKFSFTLPRL
jgi:signal transduction histidine kinase